MKVGLIELYDHSEVLRSLCQLLSETGTEISVFTHRHIYEDQYEIQALSSVQWHLQEEGQNRKDFIHRNLDQLNICDLLIFTTLLPDNAFISQIFLKPKSILIIHNGHTFFAPKQHQYLAKWGKGRVMDLFRLLRFRMRGGAKLSAKLLSNFDYLSFPGPMIDQYMKQEFSKELSKHQLIPPLPLSFYEGSPLQEKRKYVNIIIPGTIREIGKNYDLVLTAFQQNIPNIKAPIQLILLGSAQSAYAQKLIIPFQQIDTKNLKLVQFDHFIPQKEYDHWLRQADFLILPLAQTLRLDTVEERYGYTNISGGINDMIRFGIPTLLPNFYPLEEDLEGLTDRYSTAADLAEMLKRWFVNQSYQKKRAQADRALKNYSATKRRQYLKNIFSGLTE